MGCAGYKYFFLVECCAARPVRSISLAHFHFLRDINLDHLMLTVFREERKENMLIYIALLQLLCLPLLTSRPEASSAGPQAVAKSAREKGTKMAAQQTSTLYVVTRSTQKFRIGGRDNPSVGLFITRDRGTTWAHRGWHYIKCFSVAVQPGSAGKVLYLACGNGVLKSIDAGERWAITTGWKMTECLKVAIDPVSPETIYAATAYGIFKSTDGGKTWEEKNQGLSSTFTATAIIDAADPAHLFAATEAGIYHSRDRAEHWQRLGLAEKGIRTVIQSPHDARTLLLGTEDDGIFKSTDGGRTWLPVNNGLQHRTIYALAIDPNKAGVYYAGTFRGGVYKSTDAGESWQASNTGLGHMDVHALIVDPRDSNIVYCGTLGGGVFLSEDAGQFWRFIGLETSQVWDFVIQ